MSDGRHYKNPPPIPFKSRETLASECDHLSAVNAELLAALSGLSEEGCRKTDDPDADAEVLQFWQEKARAAIAKARGE